MGSFWGFFFNGRLYYLDFYFKFNEQQFVGIWVECGMQIGVFVSMCEVFYGVRKSWECEERIGYRGGFFYCT